MPSRVHESYYADHSVRLLKAIFDFELTQCNRQNKKTIKKKTMDENEINDAILTMIYEATTTHIKRQYPLISDLTDLLNRNMTINTLKNRRKTHPKCID